MKNEEVFREIDELMREGKTRAGRQAKRRLPGYDKTWFTTPESCHNPVNLPTLGKFLTT